MKRKHQIETEQAVVRTISGSGKDTFLVRVTPGGGKSALPAAAGARLKDAGLIDGVCWVVPRLALQSQAELNFIDPFFRNLFGHNLTIRAAGNDPDPCRGLDGFVTTYQALGVDKAGVIADDFRRRRYLFVADEFHHCEDQGDWHRALAPLFQLAPYKMLMTGTLERGNKKEIAFIQYAESLDIKRPVTRGADIEYIEYTRADALAEQAIIPIQFFLHDGAVRWSKEGVRFDGTIRTTFNKTDASAAVWTAISTGFADQLLDASMEHFQQYRARTGVPTQALVVTADLKHSKPALEALRRRHPHLVCDMATSHESERAIEAIKRFRAGEIDVLVTIAMAYEGLDVPGASHICCLTHIRSTPWIEQMVARGVRIDGRMPYGAQAAYVFAPDDVLFREIVAKIQAEQLPMLRKRAVSEQSELFPGEKKKIDPLESRLTGRREFLVGSNGNGRGPVAAPAVNPMRIQTPSEREKQLLHQIETRIRVHCRNNRYRPDKINRELVKKFGKSRRLMTLSELEMVWRHVQNVYPAHPVRGTRRKPPPSRGWPLQT